MFQNTKNGNYYLLGWEQRGRLFIRGLPKKAAADSQLYRLSWQPGILTNGEYPDKQDNEESNKLDRNRTYS